MKKKYIVIITIISIIISIFLLMIPLVGKYLIDESYDILNNNKNHHDFYKYFILIIILGVCTVFFKFLYNFLYSNFELKMQKYIRNDLYKNLVNSDTNTQNKYKRGEIEALFVGDVTNIIEGYLNAIPNIINKTLKAIIATIVIIYLCKSPILIVPIILSAILLLLFSIFYSRIIKNIQKQVIERDAHASSFIIESLDAKELIASYRANDRVAKWYNDLNEDAFLARKKRNRWTKSAQSVLSSFSTLIYIFVVIIGALLISKDKISYGTLIALIAIINSVYAPFITITPLLNKYNKGVASNERINQFATNAFFERNSLESFDYINISNLTFSYDKKVIDNLSVKIDNGTITKIDGKSGIGKTTLINLILGFLKPDEGNIEYVYKNEKYSPSPATRALVSYISQDNLLFEATILENFKLIADIDDKDIIKKALTMANVNNEIMELKDGLNTKILEKGDSLSKGQIERVLIAIAIAFDKPIIILDEPTASIDKESERVIIDNLKKLQKTIIYVSHRDLDMKYDNIISLKENI